MAPIIIRFSLSRNLRMVLEHFGRLISEEECHLKTWATFTATADIVETVAEKCAYLIDVRGYAAWAI